jgi:hypothetical protein
MLSSSRTGIAVSRKQGKTKLSRFVDVCHHTERLYVRLARCRRTSVLVVSGSALLLGYIYHAQRGFPSPQVHDEFSYLLAAETFASGRLTNPPHPLWTHFESMHIIQQPTYASIYPVGQGLLLAAGIRIAGHPWWGVWFSVGLMCGAICWMLQQWIPPPWALVGGLLSLRIVISYWLRSYWGGALAAAAGAVLLGASAKMLCRPRKRWALLMAVSIVILANTRPYEGLVLTLSVGVWCLTRMFRMPLDRRWALVRNAALPFAIVLIAAGIGMARYNWRVTGHALTLPYSVSFRTYLYRRMFLWQQNRPKPFYRHPVMEAAYEALERKDASLLERAQAKFERPLVMYFGGLVLLLPLTFWTWRSRRARPLLVFSGVMFVALALEYWVHPHYSAPVAAALYGVIVYTLRRVNAWGRWGGVAAKALILAAITTYLVEFAARDLQAAEITSFGVQRARIEHQLQRIAPRSLVIVRYPPWHDTTQEWVYNRADIDHAPVVWATDVSLPERRELIRYFRGRKVWILEPDHLPEPWLREYTPCEDAGPRFMPASISACY